MRIRSRGPFSVVADIGVENTSVLCLHRQTSCYALRVSRAWVGLPTVRIPITFRQAVFSQFHLGPTARLSLLVHTVARACMSVAVEATKNNGSTFTKCSVRLGTISIVHTAILRSLRSDRAHGAKNDGGHAGPYFRRFHGSCSYKSRSLGNAYFSTALSLL